MKKGARSRMGPDPSSMRDRCLLAGQATAFQKRLDLGVAAAEVAIQLQRVVGAAARQQLGAEPVAVLALQAAVFLEPFDGVGVQFFGPQISVVTGRITR